MSEEKIHVSTKEGVGGIKTTRIETTEDKLARLGEKLFKLQATERHFRESRQ